MIDAEKKQSQPGTEPSGTGEIIDGTGKKVQILTQFDADVRPSNPINVQASRDHGLRYDSSRGGYVDEDGFLVRDSFGQPL